MTGNDRRSEAGRWIDAIAGTSQSFGMRRELHERHPFGARSLYDALCRAKQIAIEKMCSLAALRYMLPWLAADLDEIDDVFRGDARPYGVEPNRPTLEALVADMAEQSLIARPVALEDVFVPIFGRH